MTINNGQLKDKLIVTRGTLKKVLDDYVTQAKPKIRTTINARGVVDLLDILIASTSPFSEKTVKTLDTLCTSTLDILNNQRSVTLYNKDMKYIALILLDITKKQTPTA